MKGQRENGNFVNAQTSSKGYTASRSYLSEIMKDKEWEKRNRSGNLSETTQEPRNDSSMAGKKSEGAMKKDKGTFTWHVAPNAVPGRKFIFR